MAIIEYLVLPKGAKKKKKRRGLGQGSGHGKTACRGHKGQTARGNTKKYKGFEGGQMPLVRRLPKKGFTNKFKTTFQIINIADFKRVSSSEGITPKIMFDKGLIKSKTLPIKVLGVGKLQKQIEVHAHAFSKTAKEAIEQAGGKIVVVSKKRVPLSSKTKEKEEIKDTGKKNA